MLHLLIPQLKNSGFAWDERQENGVVTERNTLGEERILGEQFPR
jgi:hypothetical protein